MSVPKYIWGDDQFILQQPLTRSPGGSVFAAVVRQLEYNMRIVYSQCNPPIRLHPGEIFNYTAWEHQLTSLNPQIDWKNPWILFEEVFIQYNRGGCPFSKNVALRHWVSRIFNVTNGGRSVEPEKIMQQLQVKMPLVAIINVFEDYKYSGKKPYIGKSPSMDPNEIKNIPTHAVVIIGYYVVGEDNEYHVPPGLYFMFQDTNQVHTDVCDGLFGNRISFMHPQVILGVYYGMTVAPSVLLAQERIDETIEIRKETRKMEFVEARCLPE